MIMKKKGNQLIFISQINRDGLGVTEVDKTYINIIENEIFYLKTLSLTQKTYIAFNFNAFIVKIK